ncbi:MAG TPA: protein kinase, partial [Actinomycetota bacterium]|nr:protein kinase [Actinomycetota bacterium]
MRAPTRPVALLAALLIGLTACIGSDDPPASDPIPSSLASLITPGMPRWRVLAEAPEPRQEVAAARLGGKVYVVGGLTASGATTRVGIYDVAGDSWTDGPPLPVALHHAMAAVFGGAVHVIGGFDPSSRPVASVFRLEGSAWKEAAPLRRPRAGGIAVVEKERLFVFGGQGAGELVAPVEELVDGAWVDRAPIPTPRHHVAAASDGEWIYVSGGRRPASGGPDENVAAFERFS